MKYISVVLVFISSIAISNNADAGCRGCGCRGGPGWRKANGQCASWADGGGGYGYTPAYSSNHIPAPPTPKKILTRNERKARFKWAVMFLDPKTDIQYKFLTNTTDKKLTYKILDSDGWVCQIDISPIFFGDDDKIDLDKQSAELSCYNKALNTKFYSNDYEYSSIHGNDKTIKNAGGDLSFSVGEQQYVVTFSSCHIFATKYDKGICSWKN